MIISRYKALRLLRELSMTARQSDFNYLTYLLVSNPDDMQIDVSGIVDAYLFFDEVGMLD